MRNDILLDDNLQLPVDFSQGNSDQQHVRLLVELNKGELTEYPWVGFGIERWGKRVTDVMRFRRELTVELENDGYRNPAISLKDDLSEFKISI